MFVILGLLLRALVAPIMLIATVVLLFAAALGISALFFNHVFNFGGADTSFPLFVFVFLVALGIDYNIFLMTRARQEAHRHGARTVTGLAAILLGDHLGLGRVLAGTFAVLGALPVTFLTELGFAVAFGVLLDTIVVRSVLVTALNLDLGRRASVAGQARPRGPAPKRNSSVIRWPPRQRSDKYPRGSGTCGCPPCGAIEVDQFLSGGRVPGGLVVAPAPGEPREPQRQPGVLLDPSQPAV